MPDKLAADSDPTPPPAALEEAAAGGEDDDEAAVFFVAPGTAFALSDEWQGAVPGYAFCCGEQGQGYYVDLVGQALSAESVAPDADALPAAPTPPTRTPEVEADAEADTEASTEAAAGDVDMDADEMFKVRTCVCFVCIDVVLLASETFLRHTLWGAGNKHHCTSTRPLRTLHALCPLIS